MQALSSSDSILVVDDDFRIRELLRTSLEAESFIVHEAKSSSELYEKLQNTEINLITMDVVVLERENGLDLVRDIRKLSEVPIILVTGRVDLIDTVVGLELGADDYITKPFFNKRTYSQSPLSTAALKKHRATKRCFIDTKLSHRQH